MSGIGQKQTCGIVQQIAQGHGAVKECHRLRLVLTAVRNSLQNLPLPLPQHFCGQRPELLCPLSSCGQRLWLFHPLKPFIQQSHLPVEGSLDFHKIFRRKHNLLPESYFIPALVSFDKPTSFIKPAYRSTTGRIPLSYTGLPIQHMGRIPLRDSSPAFVHPALRLHCRALPYIISASPHTRCPAAFRYCHIYAPSRRFRRIPSPSHKPPWP